MIGILHTVQLKYDVPVKESTGNCYVKGFFIFVLFFDLVIIAAVHHQMSEREQMIIDYMNCVCVAILLFETIIKIKQDGWRIIYKEFDAMIDFIINIFGIADIVLTCASDANGKYLLI